MTNTKMLKVVTEAFMEALKNVTYDETPLYVHIVEGCTQYAVIHAHSLGDVPQVGDILRLRTKTGDKIQTHFLKVTGRELNMVQDGDMKPGKVSTVTLWVEKEHEA